MARVETIHKSKREIKGSGYGKGPAVTKMFSGGPTKAAARRKELVKARKAAAAAAEEWRLSRKYPHTCGLLRVCSGKVEPHGAPISRCLYGPSGNVVATACLDGVVRLLKLPLSEANKIAYKTKKKHDGIPRLARPTISEDNVHMASLLGHDGPVRCLAWSREGSHILTGSDDRTVRLWHVSQVERPRCIFTTTSSGVADDTLGRNRQGDRDAKAARYGQGGRPSLVRAGLSSFGMSTMSLPDPSSGVAEMAKNPHSWVVGASKFQCPRLDPVHESSLEPQSPRVTPVSSMLYGNIPSNCLLPGPISDVGFYYRDRFVTFSSKSGLFFFNCGVQRGGDGGDSTIPSGERKYSLAAAIHVADSKGITAYATPNCIESPLVVLATTNRSLQLWDMNHGVCVHQLEDVHARSVHSVTFLDDSVHTNHSASALDCVLTAATDDVVRLWDLRCCESSARRRVAIERRALGHSPVGGVPDGMRSSYHLDASSYEYYRPVYGTVARACVRAFRGAHRNRTQPIVPALSPCMRYVAIGSESRNAAMYDLRTSCQICSIHGHRDVVSSVSFHPYSAEICTSSYDRTVRFYRDK